MRDLRLPDGWVGAGFVRNAVWDHLHGRPASPPAGDVDVVWFDPGQADPATDRGWENRLQTAAPGVPWSVKNQAHMHIRNDDPPYASTADAIRHWPETATAVGVRHTNDGRVELCAPFGLHDLFALLLRPTPRFAGAGRSVCETRAQAKGWLSRWPLLRWAPDHNANTTAL